jgi:hypothetical protein
MSDRFDALGRRVAAAQDALRNEARRADVRTRLLALADAPASRRGPWLLATTAVLATAALVLLLVLPSTHALSFEIGAEHEHGTVGAWVAAPAERSEILRFSDGSEIELQPHAQARVTVLERTVARVVLEHGAADVRIEPGGARTWRIDAGPYLVTVTGTQFMVAWDPQRELFELDLRVGAVTVEGPQTGGAREVHAGQRLQISDAAPEVAAVAPVQIDLPAPVEPHVEPPVPSAPVTTVERAVRERSRRAEPSAAPIIATPSWQALADGGSYRDALATAESLDFATLCTSLPEDELLRLADVARFARRPARAIEALDAVRRRFPDTDAAATAAFERGRIALDKRAHADAARWLSTYLAERPGGALAREATGRLIEALAGAGKHEDARAAARDYLDRYPKGPHADLAASVLDGGG